MKTLQFYKFLVVVLVLVNATTLFFLWKGHSPHGRPDRNQLVEHLGLEGNKKEQVLKLQDTHFKLKDALVNKSRQLHEDMFTVFNDASKDSLDVQKKIDQIVENQREIELMTFEYFKKVDALCNKSQKQQLKELIHQVLRQPVGPPVKKEAR
jgi:hypothetical protein